MPDQQAASTQVSGRERILEAAVRCLWNDGIDEVRIARVARIARVSTSTVHYHFANREQLIAAALHQAYGYAGRGRREVSTEGSVSLRLARRVERTLPVGWDQFHEWELWIELWQQAVRDDDIRGAAREAYAAIRESLVALLQEGTSAGEFFSPDPERVVDGYLSLSDGLGVRAMIDDPHVSVSEMRRQLRDYLEQQLAGLQLPSGAETLDTAENPT